MGLLVDYTGQLRIDVVKFASDLMDQPLKVLCELGGWKEARTVLQCYQQADEGQLRTALENRRRARA